MTEAQAAGPLATAIRNDFVARFPHRATRCLEDLDDEALTGETADLDAENRLTVLDRLPPARAAALFAGMPTEAQAEVLDRAPPHLALALLPSLPEGARSILLAALPKALREELERLTTLPDDAAGRFMERPAVVLRRGLTVAEALRRIRDSPARSARLFHLVDAERRLDGQVSMQALALAEPTDTVGALTEAVPATVQVTTPEDALVELLQIHPVDSVPVVDPGGRLLGIVRHDQLVAAAGEVASADMQKMVSGSADEEALSRPTAAVRRRLPWLQVNLLTAFLASAVVAVFENTIAQFTALAILLPVVAGQSGNAGAQALAVTVRGLALREIGTRQWRRLMGKELLTGLVNGVALAAVCGSGVYLWSGSYGLALVIALAMTISLPLAGVAGALVPVALVRLGQDPATASSIILTTVTDIAGFLSFLGTAAALAFLL